MLGKKLSVFLFIVVVFLFVGQSALADRTYTTSADFFDEGKADLVEVNYDTPDQLQLDITKATFSFVNVAATARGTIVRIDAESGDIIGEYRTAPEGYNASPSRTSVDKYGNVWTANRDEVGRIDGIPHGSVVKIGLVVGGTRVRKAQNDQDETVLVPDSSGDYLQGPFLINTCDDRDRDGLIRTSPFRTYSDWPDALDWSDSGKETQDGLGGTDLTPEGVASLIGNVENAEDECILLYQRLPGAEAAKHVSVDTNDDVWVGGYPDSFPGFPQFGGHPSKFLKLNGGNAEIIEEDGFDAQNDFGCGGYGGQIDSAGILWSASRDQDELLRYDPSSRSGLCIQVTESFGLGIDTNGNVWNSMGTEQSIVKLDPSGALFNNFPKTTAPPNLRDQGVAITPADNHVWVAKGFGTVVSRLNNDGDIIEVVPLGEDGSDPTGVAVDAKGKVWVTNRLSDTVMRIAPGTGGRPEDADYVASEVDRVVYLMPGSGPDNFGSMTGVVAKTETPSQGTWTVVHELLSDSRQAAISWNSLEPAGTDLKVETRSADTVDALANLDVLENQGYVEVNNYDEETNKDAAFDLNGPVIQVRVTFYPNVEVEGVSPILYDLTVKSVKPEPEDLVCDINKDKNIDIIDILGLFFTIGDSAQQPFDPRDWNHDGTITIIDARGCVLACDNALCAPNQTLR